MRIMKSAAAGLVTIAAAGTLLAGSPASAQASAVPETGHSAFAQAHTATIATSDRRRRHRHRHWRRHHRYHYRHYRHFRHHRHYRHW